MSKRPRARVGHIAELDSVPVSDQFKLGWLEVFGPLQQMAQTVNGAVAAIQNATAAMLLRLDGKDPVEWQLNLDTMRLQRKPKRL